MEIILNSKFFAALSPAQLGERVRALGYDGLDLCVRPGHPVYPATLPKRCRRLLPCGLLRE